MGTQVQAAGPELATVSSPEETREKYTLIKRPGKSRYEVAPGMQVAFATAGVQAFARFGSAAFVSGNLSNFRGRPEKPIELYEFEGCPFCRKVREVVTILDIDAIFYPCPQGGPTFRPKAKELSGKSQFPFMVDPNTGTSMLESDDIIKYLVNKYGDGTVPLPLQLGPLTTITAAVGLAPRLGAGSRYRAAKKPEKILELWAYEASPFCKLVRETLNELEIPHLYHSVARNSPKRKELTDKWDTDFQVPYLEDPNTGTALFETDDINKYLERTYAL
jgi:glutathione S-transferase